MKIYPHKLLNTTQDVIKRAIEMMLKYFESKRLVKFLVDQIKVLNNPKEITLKEFANNLRNFLDNSKLSKHDHLFINLLYNQIIDSFIDFYPVGEVKDE